ncbi:hypothetical protein AG1IA_03855 [Rhizoctonia solani AG-1 IA]|uniref:Glutathione S-transferase n=1 Tax=Thanatephorus cucumeris (strain AG1-IA) TaxID=983506 RepID=L8WZ69_THACA|nr:hypothetical protein AG1IA_03855 [Rhizoctonia solani AG-1 IA]
MSRVSDIGTPSEANEAIGGVPTLHYLDFLSRGRGEVLRLFFEDAGIAFKDHRIAFEDYNAQVKSGEIAKLNPLKSLPVVEIGGAKYAQSYAILRLLSRQLGKYDGKNDLERYYVDAINDIASDWPTPPVIDSAFQSTDAGVGPKATQDDLKHHKSFIGPKFASALNARLSANPLSSRGPFVLGKDITYADFVCIGLHVIAHDEDWLGLDTNPRLNELVQAMKARPRLVEYFKSDRYYN